MLSVCGSCQPCGTRPVASGDCLLQMQQAALASPRGTALSITAMVLLDTEAVTSVGMHAHQHASITSSKHIAVLQNHTEIAADANRPIGTAVKGRNELPSLLQARAMCSSRDRTDASSPACRQQSISSRFPSQHQEDRPSVPRQLAGGCVNEYRQTAAHCGRRCPLINHIQGTLSSH